MLGSKDKINNLSTLDEFINPVDKQIAAIFEMSSNFSMLEQSASDMDSNSFYNNSNDVVSIENEQNGSTNSENESPSHPENEEFNLKRLSVHSSGSKLNSFSTENRRRSSIRAKTKEGIRNVFNKFGKAVRSVQSKAEEVLHHDKEISDSDSDDVFINEASKTIKYKNARCNKASLDFNKVQIVQILHSNQPNSPSVSSNQPGNQNVNETVRTTLLLLLP